MHYSRLVVQDLRVPSLSHLSDLGVSLNGNREGICFIYR